MLAASEDSGPSQPPRSIRTKVKYQPEFPNSNGIRDPAAGILNCEAACIRPQGVLVTVANFESILNVQTFWFVSTLYKPPEHLLGCPFASLDIS